MRVMGDSWEMDAFEVDLAELLAICVTLARRACGVLQAVQKQRDHDGTLAAELKDPNDTRTYVTIADLQAQALIISGLRSRYGTSLAVIGKEASTEAQVSTELGLIEPLDIDLVLPPQWMIPVAVGDLCVFVHPVDGTREFVEGRLGAVQCLIGVAFRGRPIAGVAAIPFPHGLVDSAAHVLYGLVGSPTGVVGLPHPTLSKHLPNNHVTLAISPDLGKDTAVEAVHVALAGVAGVRLLPLGACGHKMLQLLTGKADAVVLNLKTALWDTCATEALVRAAGGELTNLFGWPIDYRRGTQGYANRLGVVATAAAFGARSGQSHAGLCQTLARQPAVRALLGPECCGGGGGGGSNQALDVARSIWGEPLTVAVLQRAVYKVGGKRRPAIDRFWAEEAEAVRYKQSHACRLRWVHTDDGAVEATEGAAAAGAVAAMAAAKVTRVVPADGRVYSAFFKRICMRELPHAVQKLSSEPHSRVLTSDS